MSAALLFEINIATITITSLLRTTHAQIGLHVQIRLLKTAE